MQDTPKPPKEWQEAVEKVLVGTDLTARVQHSEAWVFIGDVESGASPREYNDYFHVTVTVPGRTLVGHGETLELATTAARSRVESYLNEQKG